MNMAEDRSSAIETPPAGRVTSTYVGLALIVLVAALLRFGGTRFGFPLVLHPDEWAVVEGAIDMARRNSFEPPWSLRPDHVEMKIDYILFALYAIFKGVPIEVAFEADPVPFYWMARLVTATFGVGTVVLAFLIGNRSTRSLGLIAASVFAIFPPFILNSHYATPDVPLTFCTMLLVYLLMRYWDSPAWPWLLGASLAVAIAVAIKYPGALGTVAIAVVVIAAACRDRQWTRILTHGAGSAGAAVGFLFLISPVLFTNLSGVMRELEVQAAGDRLGHPDLGYAGNLLFYVSTFAQASGVLVALLAIVGAGVAVARRQGSYIPWLVGLVYWIALSTLPMTWARWALPMWVTPLLFASLGLEAVFRRFQSGRTRAIAPVLAAVVALHWVAGSIAVLATALAPDTRTDAVAFTKKHNITAENSIYEGYTPLLPGRYGPGPIAYQVKPAADGYRFETADGREAKYILLSSHLYGRVLEDPKRKSEHAVYRWIFTNAREIARFEPTMNPPLPSALEPVNIWRSARYVQEAAGGGKVGPTIVIYERPRVQSDGKVPR